MDTLLSLGEHQLLRPHSLSDGVEDSPLVAPRNVGAHQAIDVIGTTPQSHLGPQFSLYGPPSSPLMKFYEVSGVVIIPQS